MSLANDGSNWDVVPEEVLSLTICPIGWIIRKCVPIVEI